MFRDSYTEGSGPLCAETAHSLCAVVIPVLPYPPKMTLYLELYLLQRLCSETVSTLTLCGVRAVMFRDSYTVRSGP